MKPIMLLEQLAKTDETVYAWVIKDCITPSDKNCGQRNIVVPFTDMNMSSKMKQRCYKVFLDKYKNGEIKKGEYSISTSSSLE